MAAPRWAESDDELFLQLRDAVGERRQIADRMLEAAKGAYTWRTVDEELERLALSYDSSVDDDLAMVRGTTIASARTLIFTGDTFMVDVEVGAEVLMGQMVPAQKCCRVTLMTSQGWFAETEADDAGFFLLARPGLGPVRLQCQADDSKLITDWVVL
jgi:hypothetical protein